MISQCPHYTKYHPNWLGISKHKVTERFVKELVWSMILHEAMCSCSKGALCSRFTAWKESNPYKLKLSFLLCPNKINQSAFLTSFDSVITFFLLLERNKNNGCFFFLFAFHIFHHLTFDKYSISFVFVYFFYARGQKYINRVTHWV